MRLPFLLAVALGVVPALAQCSDAGVCALVHGAPAEKGRLSLVSQFGRSGSPDDLKFTSLRLEGTFNLGPRTSVLFVLPYGKVTGPLGSTSGLGDAILAFDQTLAHGDWGTLTGQLGARFATGRDDAGGLPQRYQRGLGSTDPLIGVRWDGIAWGAGLAYQKAGDRSGNLLEPLQREDDLLVHVGSHGRLGDFTSSFQLLAIQRLGKSDVRLPDGTLRPVPDSDRLQVNVVGGLSLPLPRGWSLDSKVAVPVLKRPDNSDGLKRALTVELGATFRF